MTKPEEFLIMFAMLDKVFFTVFKGGITGIRSKHSARYAFMMYFLGSPKHRLLHKFR